VFIAMATAICSLGHGLRFSAVPRSTQSCITSGSLNRVPASAGIRAGMSPLPCDPICHVSTHSGKAALLTNGEPLYCVYLLLLYLLLQAALKSSPGPAAACAHI